MEKMLSQTNTNHREGTCKVTTEALMYNTCNSARTPKGTTIPSRNNYRHEIFCNQSGKD